MQEVTTLAIILKVIPYKEHDSIVHVYTREYGKIAILAKGIRKMTSKNAAALQDMTLSELTIVVRPGLSRLIKASIDKSYRHIKSDLVLQVYASYMLEFYDLYIEENQPDLEIYKTLEAILDDLELGYPYELLYCLMNAFILKMTGTSLQVDECALCGRKDHISSISLQHGGFVCSHCMTLEDLPYDKSFLRSFRHLNKISIQNIDDIHIAPQDYTNLVHLFEMFVDEYSGIHLKSRQFIQQLSIL